MNTVICSNSLCGKEYHESFKKCPFCGTENPSFKETECESKQPKSKSEINRDISQWVTNYYLHYCGFCCTQFVDHLNRRNRNIWTINKVHWCRLGGFFCCRSK